jgi:hypothetical protein
MQRTVLLAVFLSTLGFAPAARAADRVLRRCPQADRLVQQHLAAEQRSLAAAVPECTAAALKARDVAGARCRIMLLRQAAAHLDVSSVDEKARSRALRKRSELAVAALELGQAVADYSPVNKIEGLDRQRFEAKALSCQALGELYDALAALPANHPSAIALHAQGGQPAPLDHKPMKEVVCGCASAAVQLASAAFVPPSDPLHNETQRALYARGCFLDVEAGRSSLVDIKRDAPGSGPASIPGPAGAGDRSAEIRRVAASRDFQLGHCKERVAQRRQRSIDREGLERCVCEVAGKWRFGPGDAALPAVDVELVPGQVNYQLTLDGDGKVSACSVVLVDKKE